MADDPPNTQHTSLTGKPSFCAVRSPSHGECTCSNNHIKKCNPAPTWRPSEAHHLVCVHSVGTELVSDPGIASILGGTTWCINDEPNMYAMPLGATTILHYCLNFLGPAAPPSFANIPQHNYDHNCADGYTHEVTASVKVLKQRIKNADHTIVKADLKGSLDTLSRKWKTILKGRGERNGGTHNSWLAASGQTIPGVSAKEWFLPFSMASKGVALDRPFPTRDFNERTKRWILVAKRLLNG